MSLATRLSVFTAALLCAGCSSVYQMSNSGNGTELSQQQRTALIAKKNAVPCRVEIICPSDMVGRYETFFTDNTCHYPLEQVLEQSFSNAVYCAFEQPGGEVLDAFTLKVEVYKSELQMDSSDARYHINLNVTFEEPGEKKVVSFSVDKSAALPSGEPNVVPAAIYEAVKSSAVDTMNKLKNDPKVVKTVKRFERK
jgi:hypothetical protein